MIDTCPDELIAGYLNGNSDWEQQKELEDWVAANPAHKRYFYEMTEIWLTAVIQKDSYVDRDLAYQRFKERVERNIYSKRLFFRTIKVVASVLAGVLLLGGGMYIERINSPILSAYTVQTIEVPLGSRSKIVLSDGTVAWLNAGSKLGYPTEFKAQERTVYLDGEGYFEVAHNEKAPFIVYMDEVAVKVLGTKFNAKAYGDEDRMEIILVEGAVEFIHQANPSSAFIMKPEQQAVFDKRNGDITVRHTPVSQANEWITGAHFFNELTFEQIARQLEKAFDVSFIFRDEDKKSLVFYGDFRSDDSLDDILEIMARGKKFDYRKTSNLIEIY
ncbi:MAG: FecR family protein [Tannerellaceae bacterium]|nr:FecR family protein [Tannerellaceae bacterium]